MKRLNKPAKRAEEFSPGQAERSEAPPWVPTRKNSRARLSGRQNDLLILLSPAKAGLILKRDPVPRVPFAALTSPWAILCRPLRRLVGRLCLGPRIIHGPFVVTLVLLIS